MKSGINYVKLSKWWRTPSARAAFRRVQKARKTRIKELRRRFTKKAAAQ